jgi:hypothetical protein
MNVETLAYILVGILVTIALVLLGWFIIDRFLKWSGARRRASELLRAVLTREQYRQLIKRGYVDIPSPRDSQRITPTSPRACGGDRKGEAKSESLPATA